MSLFEELKKRRIECMKNGEAVERTILSTLVGEIQAKAAKDGKDPSDELVEKTLIVFAENAKQCIVEGAIERNKTLLEEIAVYERYMPKYVTVNEIVAFLGNDVEKIRAAKADGPATGMAIGILKQMKVKFQGQDVSEAIKKIRTR